MAGVWNLFRIYRKAGSGRRGARVFPPRYHTLLFSTYCRSLIDSRHRQQGRSFSYSILFSGCSNGNNGSVWGLQFAVLFLSHGIYGETTIWGT
ncbi:hypothetical protein EYC80_009073 [Monilinia laxa]|uniref:Uncharacterized protein n=1 Tax=Monilinia laxa TaxID=61186 RepID=A0A5N6K2B3_MONLA|nr:hypothetical protein EYC80_009073 [Monilinia laxa]